MQHKTGLVHLGYIVWDYFYSNIVTLVKVASHTFTQADTVEYPEQMP